MNNDTTIPSQLGPVDTIPSSLGPLHGAQRTRGSGASSAWPRALVLLLVLVVLVVLAQRAMA